MASYWAAANMGALAGSFVLVFFDNFAFSFLCLSCWFVS